MKRILIGLILTLASGFCFSPLTSIAQERGTLVAKKVAELPEGPLFWRIENYSTLNEAQAAAGPTGLAAEAGGKVWLFTLGPEGGSSAGGKRVAEVGPLAPVVATQYLLRIDQAVGRPGSKRGAHTHPGTEAFFVLAGEQIIRTPQGVITIGAGQSHSGVAGGIPMQSFSGGSTDMLSLVMFLVDATKPFSSPATVP